MSNLTYISKLLEKATSCQLKEHKQENRLDEPLQSAYKHSHSTQTALLKVFSDILTKMDDKELVFLTLLDLSAAFDTVDHHILVNRLRSCIGITEGAIEWIQSYLHDRTQKVIVNGSLEGKFSTATGMLCTSRLIAGAFVLFRLYQATGSSFALTRFPVSLVCR